MSEENKTVEGVSAQAIGAATVSEAPESVAAPVAPKPAVAESAADDARDEAAEPGSANAKPEVADPASDGLAAKPAPISAKAEVEAPVIRRQSLALRTGACDMRVGAGAAERIGTDLRGTVGKPRAALLVSGEDVSAELVESVRRSLVDVGFAVTHTMLPSGRAARPLEVATGLYRELDAAGINADDAMVAVGDANVISACVFAASTWCGGCALAAVPTTLDGMVDIPVTPRALDVPNGPALVLARGNVRLLVCDLAAANLSASNEGNLMGRAVMVAGAVTAGERSFSELALHADAVLSGEVDGLTEELLELTKARARTASSSAVAIRQGLAYGRDFARALRACLPSGGPCAPTDAALLAEGLRISARLAAAHQAPETDLVELVFAQDALLDKLGLAEVPCDIAPQKLVEAFTCTGLRHSNRLMPALPLGYGRVRLTAVDDEMLLQHLTGWCRARRKLKRRLEREAR